jgi:hypothetical protein
MTPRQSPTRVVAAAFPVIGVLFTGYLPIGIATPAPRLHVHQDLGPFIVGRVAGSQFGVG